MSQQLIRIKTYDFGDSNQIYQLQFQNMLIKRKNLVLLSVQTIVNSKWFMEFHLR